MKKKILITGGSGLLGVNWAFHTLEKFDVVLALHNKKITINNVRCIDLDLSNIDKLTSTLSNESPDIIIHTAGLTNIEEIEKVQSLVEDTNYNLTTNLASACSILSLKLVFISSDQVFNGSVKYASEDTEVNPLNFYGLSKANSEKYLLLHCPNSLIIRTNFYGWGTKYRKSFSDRIIESLRRGERIKLFYDVIYTPVLIDTLIEFSHDLATQEATGIFHIASNDRISKYHFGLLLADCFGLDTDLIIPISFDSMSHLAPRPKEMSLSNGKVISFLRKNVGTTIEHIHKLQLQENMKCFREIRALA